MNHLGPLNAIEYMLIKKVIVILKIILQKILIFPSNFAVVIPNFIKMHVFALKMGFSF